MTAKASRIIITLIRGNDLPISWSIRKLREPPALKIEIAIRPRGKVRIEVKSSMMIAEYPLSG